MRMPSAQLLRAWRRPVRRLASYEDAMGLRHASAAFSTGGPSQLQTPPQPSSVSPASDANTSSNEDRRIATRLSASAVADQAVALATRFLVDPQSNASWQVIGSEHLQYVKAPPDWEDRVTELQKRICVQFRDVTRLKTALVHHGALDQVPADVTVQRLSNRSLEFLGDSVLGMCIASYAFQSQPQFQEGQLSRFKEILVNNQTLSKVAELDLEIHALILVGREYSLDSPSTEKWYRKGRQTIQAGALEALIAAVYLDQGLETALSFVNEVVLPSAIKYATEQHIWQPVVELQILLQAHGYGHPVYKNVPAPSTSTTFCVQLVVLDEVILTGKGASYREARVKAAEAGYQHYSPILTARGCVEKEN